MDTKKPSVWRAKNGAGEETRTLDVHLGKVVLYQLSYACVREVENMHLAPCRQLLFWKIFRVWLGNNTGQHEAARVLGQGDRGGGGPAGHATEGNAGPVPFLLRS